MDRMTARVWWTLTIVAAVATILGSLLDAPPVLGIIGIVATIVGSAWAAMRGVVERLPVPSKK
jgi:hypothetical protein